MKEPKATIITKRFTLMFALFAAFTLSDVSGGLYAGDTPVAAQQADQTGQQGEDENQTADKPSRLQTRAERRRARIMSEYEATGKVDTCVPMRTLRQSHIFDDQTIFFEAPGKRGYLNRMPSKCAGLLREERFAYANSFGSLCRGEIITVLDAFGRTWGSCGLGDFEEFSKKPKADNE